MSGGIMYLHDAHGNFISLPIPAPPEQTAAREQLRAHDLAAFAEFMAAWTFPYAYAYAVNCPGCHASCGDWRQNDSFILVNATIGGLLVFRCGCCGGTIRQKFFKDHMACEFTPPGQ